MRFEQFHLYKTDFSRAPLEHTLADITEEAFMELTNAFDFIQNASYHLDGFGWATINKPLSPYAKEHFLYIQSFAYYEVQTYFTKRKNLDSYQINFPAASCGVLAWTSLRSAFL